MACSEAERHRIVEFRRRGDIVVRIVRRRNFLYRRNNNFCFFQPFFIPTINFFDVFAARAKHQRGLPVRFLRQESYVSQGAVAVGTRLTFFDQFFS